MGKLSVNPYSMVVVPTPLIATFLILLIELAKKMHTRLEKMEEQANKTCQQADDYDRFKYLRLLVTINLNI